MARESRSHRPHAYDSIVHADWYDSAEDYADLAGGQRMAALH